MGILFFKIIKKRCVNFEFERSWKWKNSTSILNYLYMENAKQFSQKGPFFSLLKTIEPLIASIY